MKKFAKSAYPAIVTLSGAALPTLANAHPGEHSGNLIQSASHVVASSWHWLALLAVAVCGVSVILTSIWSYRSRKV